MSTTNGIDLNDVIRTLRKAADELESGSLEAGEALVAAAADDCNKYFNG